MATIATWTCRKVYMHVLAEGVSDMQMYANAGVEGGMGRGRKCYVRTHHV